MIVVGLLVVPLLVLLAVLVALEVRRRARRAGAATAVPQPSAGATWDTLRRGAWTAEIQWRSEAGAARFRVVSSPPGSEDELALLESRRLDWPPRSDAVESLGDAVAELERSLVAAGWEPADRGSAWFARRFVWPRSDRPPRPMLQPAHAAEEARRWAN